MDLNDLLSGLMADMKKVSDTASMIGEPVKVGSSHMVPLLGVTIGFGTATTDVSGNSTARGGKMDGGGAGGTMVVTPRAFVVVDGNGVPQLIALKDGKYAEVHESIELAAAAKKIEAPAPAALPEGGKGESNDR